MPKNLDDKEIGKDTYPPNPKIRFGLSFLRIFADFIIEKKISKKELG